MKYVLFACLVLASVAFASGQTTEGKAVAYIYSYATTTTIGRLKKPIYLDDKEIADIRPERYFIALIEPGKHTVHLRNKKLGGIEKEFEAGKTYYLRVDWKNNGMTISPAGIFSAPAENGEFDIKQLRTIDTGNIKEPAIVVLKLP